MSNKLTAKELEQIQIDLEDTLPDLCNLLTPTRTSNGAGGYTSAWGTAKADVPCRMDNPIYGITYREQLAAGAVQPFNRLVITLPHDTAISSTYRIEYEGDTYSVTGLMDSKSWIGCVRAMVEKV